MQRPGRQSNMHPRQWLSHWITRLSNTCQVFTRFMCGTSPSKLWNATRRDVYNVGAGQQSYSLIALYRRSEVKAKSMFRIAFRIPTVCLIQPCTQQQRIPLHIGALHCTLHRYIPLHIASLHTCPGVVTTKRALIKSTGLKGKVCEKLQNWWCETEKHQMALTARYR